MCIRDRSCGDARTTAADRSNGADCSRSAAGCGSGDPARDRSLSLIHIFADLGTVQALTSLAMAPKQRLNILPARHHSPHRSPEKRIQRTPRSPPLESRAHLRLAPPIPPSAHPLRPSLRHPQRLPTTRLLPHLLQILGWIVLLGALSENNCPTLLRTIAGPPVIFIYQGTFVRLGFGVEGV